MWQKHLRYREKTLKITLRPAVSKTPVNRSHQRVDFGSTPASAQIGMRSRYVTQSNGVVVQKSPPNMGPDGAGSHPRKQTWRMFCDISVEDLLLLRIEENLVSLG